MLERFMLKNLPESLGGFFLLFSHELCF